MQKEKENPVTSVHYKWFILVLCAVTFPCLKDNMNYFSISTVYMFIVFVLLMNNSKYRHNRNINDQ